MERVRAAGQFDQGYRGPKHDQIANAIGAELFGDERVQRLKTCRVCGVLGDLGDDCGRAPEGHTLVPM